MAFEARTAMVRAMAVGQQVGTRHAADAPQGEDELRRLLLPHGRSLNATRHEVISRRGAVAEHVYLVQHGWVALRGPRDGGRSSILRIFLPGEIIGLAEIGLTRVPQDVVMLTEGVLSAVPRGVVETALRTQPHLCHMVVSLAGAELAAAQTRAVLFDQMSAEDRLIHLLLDIRSRLAVAGVGDGNRFPLPLNQTEIGEATGMTGIYVNRLMRRMVCEKRIEVQRPYVRLLDRMGFEARLAALNLAPVAEAVWPGKG